MEAHRHVWVWGGREDELHHVDATGEESVGDGHPGGVGERKVRRREGRVGRQLVLSGWGKEGKEREICA
jgi:hypothetical protein